jgi:hypothetical protein
MMTFQLPNFIAERRKMLKVKRFIEAHHVVRAANMQ